MIRSVAAAAFLVVLALISSPMGATEYVAFGDSITAGEVESNGVIINFDEEDRGGYPGRLEELLIGAGNSGDTVRNEGIGSLDSQEALSEIDNALLAGGDVMLLMLGTNDVKPVSRMERSFEEVLFNLDMLRQDAAAAGMDTISATIIPRPPSANIDSSNEVTFAIVKAIREIQAENDRPLVNIWEFFARIPEEERYDTYYFSLNSSSGGPGHPNAAGFKLIAESFRDFILGIDSLEPLVGPLVQPGPGITTVALGEEIELVLYDFLTGIDRRATILLLNGEQVETDVASNGQREKATLKLQLADFEDCGLRLEVVSRDRAETPNRLDSRVRDLGISGRKIKAGDVDFDCRVDGIDLVLFAFHFGATKGEARYDPAANFNFDDVIDGDDLMLLSKNFGKSSK